MQYFTSINIIPHRFYVDNNEGELGIGYAIIIGSDLMVHIGHSANFRHQVIQLDVSVVLMKYPSGLIG